MDELIAPSPRLDDIRQNIFPAARDAVDWSNFHWHTYAHSPKSSQALAIDVFGTIKTQPGPVRDAIFAAIARRVDVPHSGPWHLDLEWSDPSNGLNELTTTKVDAVAIGRDATLLFECKFTEAGGGCSQIAEDKRGIIACNGSYRVQPGSQTIHKCALTGKRIRYWEFIPQIYGVDATADYDKCPFALDTYQWMRNVVLARSLQQTTGKRTRVVAAYADAPFLRTASKVRNGVVLGRETLQTEDAIIPLSYQQLIEIASEVAPSDCWRELTLWVQSKIEHARTA